MELRASAVIEEQTRVLAEAAAIGEPRADVAALAAEVRELRRRRAPTASRFADHLPPPDPAAEPGTMTESDVLAARAARYIPPVLPEAPAFQQALDHARDLIAAGSNDEAWEVIREALPEWEPDSPYRIAPVILRVDPEFRPVITPDRYRTIVTTHRDRAGR